MCKHAAGGEVNPLIKKSSNATSAVSRVVLAKRCSGTESSLAECGVTVETTDCLVLGFTMPCQPGETATTNSCYAPSVL